MACAAAWGIGLMAFGMHATAQWVSALGQIEWEWSPFNASVTGLVHRTCGVNCEPVRWLLIAVILVATVFAVFEDTSGLGRGTRREPGAGGAARVSAWLGGPHLARHSRFGGYCNEAASSAVGGHRAAGSAGAASTGLRWALDPLDRVDILARHAWNVAGIDMADPGIEKARDRSACEWALTIPPRCRLLKRFSAVTTPHAHLLVARPLMRGGG